MSPLAQIPFALLAPQPVQLLPTTSSVGSPHSSGAVHVPLLVEQPLTGSQLDVQHSLVPPTPQSTMAGVQVHPPQVPDPSQKLVQLAL
jgi:hypothetical protein